MRKFGVILCVCVLLSIGEANAKGFDGELWSDLSEREKHTFIIAYMIGHDVGLSLGQFVFDKVLGARSKEAKEALENYKKSLSKIDMSIYVQYLNQWYQKDERNMVIPVRSLIALIQEYENYGLSEKEVLQQIEKMR